MGDVVDLKGKPIPTRDDLEFVTDMARFADGLTDESAIRKKYRLAEDVWNALGEDDDLVRTITEEKIRRMRSGATKREKAQLHVMRAPEVAAKIMLDESANNRHRLDACRVLDDFSQTGPTAAPAADRFCITINLGADSYGKPIIESYNKSLAIDPNDTAPDVDIEPAAIMIGADSNKHGSRGRAIATPPAIASKDPMDVALDALMAFDGAG